MQCFGYGLPSIVVFKCSSMNNSGQGDDDRGSAWE